MTEQSLEHLESQPCPSCSTGRRLSHTEGSSTIQQYSISTLIPGSNDVDDHPEFSLVNLKRRSSASDHVPSKRQRTLGETAQCGRAHTGQVRREFVYFALDGLRTHISLTGSPSQEKRYGTEEAPARYGTALIVFRQ